MCDSKENGRIFVLETINGIERLNVQYEKELKDAEAGVGLCKGIPENSRKAIASMLTKHIDDNKKAIKEYLDYMVEIDNE